MSNQIEEALVGAGFKSQIVEDVQSFVKNGKFVIVNGDVVTVCECASGKVIKLIRVESITSFAAEIAAI